MISKHWQSFLLFTLAGAMLLMNALTGVLAQDQDGAPAAAGTSAAAQDAASAMRPAADTGDAAPGDADQPSPPPPAAGKPGFNSCINCHWWLLGEHQQLVDQFRSSIHAEIGLGCEACHGGDPTTMKMDVSMGAKAGYVGRPDRASVPGLCARCHSNGAYMKPFGGIRTDQLELYRTSAHGIALFQRGNRDVAVCSDCHSAHNILRVKNPNSTVYKLNVVATCGRCHGDAKLMQRYGIDATIPEQYTSGVHGQNLFEKGDLGSPVCNDCHGNHGATPPGVSSIEHVCGQCHLKTEKYYKESPHASAFAALGLGRCVVCHNQHALKKPSDNYLDPKAEPNCAVCHERNTPAYATIVAMKDAIIATREMHENAQREVEETERTTHLSMYEMIPQVEQIHTQMLTARILQHAGNLKEMQANRDEAAKQFAVIQQFTDKLQQRSRFNKMMVTVLAVFLFCYGIFLLGYKSYVLDREIPWQYYEGKPLE